MILKKTYFFDVISSAITPYKTKSFFLILILLPSFFVSIGFETFNHANASSNLGESIDKFRNNLQSSIDKQISSLSLNNVNLKGSIVSTEYNTTTGVIVNSLFGNWSLTTRDGNFKGFNSSFTKQPVFYNSNNAVLSNSTADTSSNNVLAGNAGPIAGSTNNDAISSVSSPGEGFNNETQSTIGNQQDSNLTSYDLSNFRVNAINQQNNDITYHGKIDVVREVQSLDTVSPDETNTFKDINASVSILGNRILVINFKQMNLLDEFTNIPLVGIVK